MNMSPQLTSEQRSALHQANDVGPIVVVDPASRAHYVLIREDEFKKYSVRRDEDFDPRVAYPFISEVMAEDDTADPLLASYQNEQPRGASA